MNELSFGWSHGWIVKLINAWPLEFSISRFMQTCHFSASPSVRQGHVAYFGQWKVSDKDMGPSMIFYFPFPLQN
jgi:hypothetical protein